MPCRISPVDVRLRAEKLDRIGEKLAPMLLCALLLTGWLHTSSSADTSSRYGGVQPRGLQRCLVSQVWICLFRRASPQRRRIINGRPVDSEGFEFTARLPSSSDAARSKPHTSDPARAARVRQVAFVETEWDPQVTHTLHRPFVRTALVQLPSSSRFRFGRRRSVAVRSSRTDLFSRRRIAS